MNPNKNQLESILDMERSPCKGENGRCANSLICNASDKCCWPMVRTHFPPTSSTSKLQYTHHLQGTKDNATDR